MHRAAHSTCTTTTTITTNLLAGKFANCFTLRRLGLRQAQCSPSCSAGKALPAATSISARQRPRSYQLKIPHTGARSKNHATMSAATSTTNITHVFFDCDDACYQNDWATARKITEAIANYTQKLGVTGEQSYELYKKHGTCLKGLLVEGLIAPGEGVEDFLEKAHDIQYDDIAPDPRLRKIVLDMRSNLSRYVFTASTKEHAMRCLTRVTIDDCFPLGVIDTRVCELETKHSTHSFLRAMEYVGLLSLPPAGESDGNGNGSTRLSDDEAIAAASVHAGRCLLIDDSVKNIVTAKKMGWCTVLIGKVERDTGNAMPTPAEADHHVSTIHEIVDVLPALFEANEPMAAAAAV